MGFLYNNCGGYGIEYVRQNPGVEKKEHDEKRIDVFGTGFVGCRRWVRRLD